MEIVSSTWQDDAIAMNDVKLDRSNQYNKNYRWIGLYPLAARQAKWRRLIYGVASCKASGDLKAWNSTYGSSWWWANENCYCKSRHFSWCSMWSKVSFGFTPNSKKLHCPSILSEFHVSQQVNMDFRKKDQLSFAPDVTINSSQLLDIRRSWRLINNIQ